MKTMVSQHVSFLLIFTGIIWILLSGCTQQKDFEYALDLPFKTLDGRQHSLREFAGKIVVLDLMAVNCQPCWYQMLELKKYLKIIQKILL